MRFNASIIPAPMAAIALTLLLSPVAVAATGHGHKSQSACHHLPPRQVGKAMFYGEPFNGRTMANGKTFDMNALTAASRTLPLGTRARVTNLKTHRSTTVTITDRGRLRAKNVILDLSVGAARAIGLTEREGVTPVSIQPVGFTGKTTCS
jgi:rare lipoprotein A